MKIIKCKRQYIDQVVDIFGEAFKESILFFTKPGEKVRHAFVDIFYLIFETYQNSFFVAVDKDNKVVGYIIIVKDIKKLWVESIKSGFIVKALIKWFLGKYSINLKAAFKILINKIHYFIFVGHTETCAQILSIAVNQEYQGRGIGKELVRNGLEYLKKEEVKRVKLEVRTDNIPAKKIYEKFGFKAVDKVKDLQGEWIIMKADI